MATIRRRGNSWQVQVYAGRIDGKQRVKTRTVRGTAQDAQRAAKQLEREVHLGFHPATTGDGETVASIAERWHAMKTRTRWSPTTSVTARSHIDNYIKPAIGSVPIDQLRLTDVEMFIHSIDLKASTVARIAATLSGACAQAVRWGEIPSSPCIGMELPRGDEQEPTMPTVDELAAIIAAMPTTDLQCAIHVAASTGVRRGQLVALRWRDIDFDAGQVTFDRNIVYGPDGLHVKGSKNNRIITVAIGASTVAVLRARRTRAIEYALRYGHQIGPDCWVFSHDPQSLEPWRPNYLTDRFMEVRDRLDLGHVKLHHLRHWAATQMLSNGIDVKTVAGRLGHSDPSVTLRRYAHVIPAADRHAADLLDGLLG